MLLHTSNLGYTQHHGYHNLYIRLLLHTLYYTRDITQTSKMLILSPTLFFTSPCTLISHWNNYPMTRKRSQSPWTHLRCYLNFSQLYIFFHIPSQLLISPTRPNSVTKHWTWSAENNVILSANSSWLRNCSLWSQANIVNLLPCVLLNTFPTTRPCRYLTSMETFHNLAFSPFFLQSSWYDFQISTHKHQLLHRNSLGPPKKFSSTK